jgi:DNA-binding beta-propeller fold protein YncE
MRLWTGVIALLAAATLCSQPQGARLRVGPLADGGVMLDTAWLLRPAGRQIPLGSFPMTAALSPDGKYLLALNAGYETPSVSVIEVSQARELERVSVPDAWGGLAFNPKGDRVYAGGGAQASVLEFTFAGGRLSLSRTMAVVDPAQRSARDFVGNLSLSPDGRLIYATELFRDSIAVINPQSGRVIERFKTGRRPYAILFHPDGASLFVSCWADGYVLRHGAEKGEIMARMRIAPHPTGMAWLAGKPEVDPESPPSPYSARIFVAAANTNSVYVLGITEANDVRLAGRVSVAMTDRQPVGMTPSALGVDSESRRLYVACSDANAVTVLNVSGVQARVLGMLPAGAYPTAVLPLPGGRLAVLNGKGVGSSLSGTASLLDAIGESGLDEYTRTVFENSPYRDSLLDGIDMGKGNPIAGVAGGSSPIENVIYVLLKSGLTYDETLGDLTEGNGDASLARHGLANYRKLAREYVLLDNFYRNGDGLEDGVYWATSGIAPDYVQKLWGGVAARRSTYNGFDGSEPAAAAPAGSLWTNAALAGVSFRNYGCFPGDASLKQNTAPEEGGSGTAGAASRCATAFLRDWEAYAKNGQKPPRLHTLCLDGDPADMDAALGALVEGVSKSGNWKATAVFVIHAGGPHGTDHVDPRRSPMFVISPYTRRRVVNSTFYNTLSALRTIELILGLRPMTHYDAAALPLAACFQPAPDTTPFVAVGPVR